MDESKKVVRSIDLGYGFTKFIQSVNIKGVAKPCSFPSIVASAGNKSLGAGVLSERETTVVMHDGVMFEAGKDVVLSASGYGNRVLNNNYTSSNDYHVLMKAALKMMNLDEIDLLVLGSPVSNFESVKKRLVSDWKGVIDLDGTKKIKINGVLVLPQPIGGFALYGEQSGEYNRIKGQRNLIIDPGYFTFDWLLMDNMKTMQDSGSYEGGMSFVINAIVKEMGKDANTLTTITRIDDYFYQGKEMIYKGEPFNLDKYKPISNNVIEKSVQTMMTALSDINNIDNILLIGGAAETYLPAVKKLFGDRPIMHTKSSAFSNVLGYQHIGNSKFKGK